MTKHRTKTERHLLAPALPRRRFLTAAGALGAVGLMGGLSGCAASLARFGKGPYAAPGDFPAPKFVETNAIRLAVYEQGHGFPVIFSHGWPELAYSWRHQLPALADAGYHAMAPDQRGYGLTSVPAEIEAYGIENLCGDLVGLMDARGIEKAVFCGHDWGGFIVWAMPLLHPDRTAGVIGVNTPFLPRTPIPTVQFLKATMGEEMYIVYFQEPGKAEALIEPQLEKFFSRVFRKGGMTQEEFAALPREMKTFSFERMLELPEEQVARGEPLFNEAQMKYWIDRFSKTGMSGGINYYRNLDRNWETLGKVPEYKVNCPSLMISAANDVVLPPSMANGMERFVPDLEKHVIPDCGHWTQQEKPDELNALIIDWLDRRFGGGVA
jgi:pimeloyl-ACP methyl ester carboxylesterase